MHPMARHDKTTDSPSQIPKAEMCTKAAILAGMNIVEPATALTAAMVATDLKRVLFTTEGSSMAPFTSSPGLAASAAALGAILALWLMTRREGGGGGEGRVAERRRDLQLSI